MLRALAAAILALGLAGCQNLPPPFPPPAQFVPFETFRPYRITRTVNVADDGAADHFVSGILPLTGSWSWTNQRPTVKVTTAGTEKVHYLIDFTIPDVTFKTTGPVTVTFLVNDHTLGTQLYDKSGTKHWEKVVPAEWLRPKSETLIAAEVDKVFVSPDDGVRLGMILSSIGLVERPFEQ